MKISHREEVKEYYQNETVADRYITKRFSEPLNYLEHQRQVQILNSIIKSSAAQQILEFAPGPARITAEIEKEGGTSIDSSKQMLNVARERMEKTGKKWTFKEGDILNLDLQEKYDLIFSFRFLLHFHQEERKKIYQQARKGLKKNGYFVFEVMNKEVVLPLRRMMGNKKYFVYDKLYQKKEFIAEMEQNGFRVIRLYPILSHFWLQALFSRPFKIAGWKKMAKKTIVFWEKFESNQPYEWVALCQKK